MNSSWITNENIDSNQNVLDSKQIQLRALHSADDILFDPTKNSLTANGRQRASCLTEIFPRGRRPFVKVSGLDYGSNYELLETTFQSVDIDETVVEVGSYEFNSFVCENGYLSEEECFETPKEARKKRQQKCIKMNAELEMKKKYHKLEQISKPEIFGPFFCTGKKKCEASLKEWTGVCLSSPTILTGLAIEDTHMRKIIGQQKISSCLQSKSMSLQRLQLNQKMNFQSVAAASTNVDLLNAPSSQLLDKISKKYNTKYYIKWRVQDILSHWEKIDQADISLQSLYGKVKADTNRPRTNSEELWKYVNKYFFKFKYKTWSST